MQRNIKYESYAPRVSDGCSLVGAPSVYQ